MSDYYVGGHYAAEDALRQGNLRQLLLQEGKRNRRIDALAERAQAAGVELLWLPYYQLDVLVPGVRHQGVVSRCQRKNQAENWREALHGRAAPLILILDGIQDPHNLGACLRSAAAADVDCVLLPNHSACDLTPAARNVSRGGSEIVPLFRVSNLRREIEAMKKSGIWVVAASGESASPLYDCDWRQPTALILGHEGEGIAAGLLASSDQRAAIPMHNGMESLNVSVACGIFLFEALRQRR